MEFRLVTCYPGEQERDRTRERQRQRERDRRVIVRLKFKCAFIENVFLLNEQSFARCALKTKLYSQTVENLRVFIKE